MTTAHTAWWAMNCWPSPPATAGAPQTPSARRRIPPVLSRPSSATTSLVPFTRNYSPLHTRRTRHSVNRHRATARRTRAVQAIRVRPATLACASHSCRIFFRLCIAPGRSRLAEPFHFVRELCICNVRELCIQCAARCRLSYARYALVARVSSSSVADRHVAPESVLVAVLLPPFGGTGTFASRPLFRHGFSPPVDGLARPEDAQ
jgi:hypothetical protein